MQRYQQPVYFDLGRGNLERCLHLELEDQCGQLIMNRLLSLSAIVATVALLVVVANRSTPEEGTHINESRPLRQEQMTRPADRVFPAIAAEPGEAQFRSAEQVLDTRDSDVVEATVLVLSDLGNALPGATISDYGTNGRDILATTDGLGIARVPVKLSSDMRYWSVSGEGFASALIDIDCSKDSLHSVIMRTEGRISGKVLFPKNCDHSGALQVAAIGFQEGRKAVARRASEQRLLAARSSAVEEDGSFLITQLVEGEDYQLRVLGKGVASKLNDPESLVQASTRDARVRAFPIYGKILRVSSLSGPISEGTFIPQWRIRKKRSYNSVAGSHGREYSGPGSLDLPDQHDQFALAYAIDTDVLVEDPAVTVSLRAIGFEDYEAEVELERFSPAKALGTHEVLLTPNARGYGSITVNLENELEEMIAERQIAGKLELKSIRTNQEYNLPFRCAEGERAFTFKFVPTDEYTWKLELDLCGLSFPAGDDGKIFVLDGGKVQLKAQMQATGYLSLECVDLEDKNFWSRFEIHKIVGYTGSSPHLAWVRQFECEAVPLVVGPLSAGEYTVFVAAPKALRSEPLTVNVIEGNVAQEVFVMPRK